MKVCLFVQPGTLPGVTALCTGLDLSSRAVDSDSSEHAYGYAINVEWIFPASMCEVFSNHWVGRREIMCDPWISGAAYSEHLLSSWNFLCRLIAQCLESKCGNTCQSAWCEHAASFLNLSTAGFSWQMYDWWSMHESLVGFEIMRCIDQKMSS